MAKNTRWKNVVIEPANSVDDLIRGELDRQTRDLHLALTSEAEIRDAFSKMRESITNAIITPGISNGARENLRAWLRELPEDQKASLAEFDKKKRAP